MNIQTTPPQRGYELRRWPRYKVDIPVQLIAQRPTKVSIVQGRGRELNGGGMAVLLGSELGIDEQVAVEFTPPYCGQPIRVRAFVRNRSGSSYGIEFITENDADYINVGQLESVLKALGSMNKDAPRTQFCA
jgi:hypothetical protein